MDFLLALAYILSYLWRMYNYITRTAGNALTIHNEVYPQSKCDVDHEPNYNSHLCLFPTRSGSAGRIVGCLMYENVALPQVSNSEPSSQNTGGFGSQKKKRGNRLNMPMRMSCGSIEEEDPDATWDKEAVPALSSESIIVPSALRYGPHL